MDALNNAENERSTKQLKQDLLVAIHDALKVAEDFMASGEVPSAVIILKKIIEIKPRFPIAHHYLGRIALSQQDRGKAINHLSIALASDNNADVYSDFAAALLMSPTDSSAIEQAVEYALKAILIVPKHVSAHIQLGLCYYYQKDYEQAKQIFSKIIEFNPSHPDVYNNLCLVNRALGHTEQAIAVAQKALQVKPEYIPAKINLGNIFLDLGQLDQAEVYFLQALDNQTKLTAAYNGLGEVYRKKNQYEEAFTYFKLAIDLNPKYALAYNNIALLQQRQGDYEQAITTFELAIKKVPQDYRAYLNLGQLYFERRSLEQAARYIKVALQLNPEDGCAQHIMAVLNQTTTDRAPEDYILKLFNDYAGDFETHLVQHLGYDIPMLLRNQFDRTVELCHFDCGLDLGCGTGLSGQAITSLCQQLIGVDIAPNMVTKAKQKGIYHKVIVSDLITYLTTTQERFDLVICTDVLVYFGDLESLFIPLLQRLKSKAVFLFCAEYCEQVDDHYVLRQTGRYAHSISYIESLCQQFRLKILSREQVNIRRHGDQWEAGQNYIVQYL